MGAFQLGAFGTESALRAGRFRAGSTSGLARKWVNHCEQCASLYPFPISMRKMAFGASIKATVRSGCPTRCSPLPYIKMAGASTFLSPPSLSLIRCCVVFSNCGSVIKCSHPAFKHKSTFLFGPPERMSFPSRQCLWYNLIGALCPQTGKIAKPRLLETMPSTKMAAEASADVAPVSVPC